MILHGLGGLIAWILWGLLVTWVANDAQRRYPWRSYKPIAWTFLAFFFPVIGWLIYLLLRPDRRYR
jgi:hypothetical protein